MKKIRFQQILKCFYTALIDTINHDGVEHAGYLAFLSLLSFFPFLVFFTAAVGAMGESELGLQFMHLLLTTDILPKHLISTIEPRIAEIVSGPPQGLMTLAVIGAIWTASSAVEGLRTILNRAYRVNTPPAYILRRLMSVGQFLILTLIVIVVMLTFVLAPVLWQVVQSVVQIDIGFLAPSWTYLRYAVTIFLLLGVVSAMYYILPNVKQNWKVVLPGASVVVVAWVASGALFSVYLSNFNQVNVIYGSLGGIIVSLLFFYIMGMILVYGAEFNYNLSKLKGEKVVAKEAGNKKQLKAKL